jgi:glycosyltransferase involved in cell wall biosynthesis
MHVATPIRSATASVSVAPLRIMYVLGAFPVLSETFVSNEIRAVRAQGDRVVPLALAPYNGSCQPEDEVFRAETLALGAIPAMPALARMIASPSALRSALQFASTQTGIRPRSLLLAGARVALAARQQNCTHLHAHFALPAAATAIVAARLAGLTCSFIGHGYDVYGTPMDLKLKLECADISFATCEDMADDFHALAPTARVRVLRCGVDPDRFRPQPGLPRNGRLLAVGRLVEQKGYDVLLRALAALPPEHRPVIDVVGGGELAEQLPRDAASRGVSEAINFLGPRPGGWIAENGPAYLGFVAPYCLTATGDRDTGPLVVKEALAMGLPVVASALMGLKETVTPACGRLVPQRDVPALAAALRWIAELPEPDRQRLGAAGRAHIEAGFTIAGQATGLVDAIREAQAARGHHS